MYVTTTYTRPDTTVPFFEITEEETAVFQKFYDNGYMHHIDDHISDDGLVWTRSLCFYVDSFPVDSMIINQMVRSDVGLYDFYIRTGEYCKTHGITRSDVYLKIVHADLSIVHETHIMSEFLF